MEEHKLKSWEEFRPLIQDIRKRFGAIQRELPDGSVYDCENNILFRGQPNADWELETTLERKSGERYDILGYIIDATYPTNEIESFTGNRWNIPPSPELRESINKNQDSMRVYLPCYEYLVYLRHHGFPSPLLDWTESPFIAAYFAFCDDVKSEHVAVFAYVETPAGFKSKRGGHPMITVMGPYATTHARHFAQKAWYTIATEWSQEKREHYFCPHKDVLQTSSQEQDVLIKITIPAGHRLQALRELSDYNINHFTLFQTEDALVKAMAMKQFDTAAK